MKYFNISDGHFQVQDKLDKVAPYQPRPSAESQDLPRAEDVYEILCNDVVLPLGMNLAAVRQYVWKQSAELIMHYRRRRMT
jgi:WD repeat-containing protein 48